MEYDYESVRGNLIVAALRVATHEWDKAEDPGWQAELDREILKEETIKFANMIEYRRSQKNVE